MNPILSAGQITKSFLLNGKKTTVLAGLDFEIAEREFVSIIGSSGCGKSTLLELFAGITKPDLGDIVFEGKVITGTSGMLGYMPQEDLLFPWLNTLQNVLLPVRIRGGNYAMAKLKALDLLPTFGLDKHAKHLPYQLSGGLKQRAAFLRTYMTGSSLLLLDEPFANLDALTRLQLQDWLLEIKDRLELTIIMVTHDIAEALKLSDRILVMGGSPGKFINTYVPKAPHSLDTESMEQIRLELMSWL